MKSIVATLLFWSVCAIAAEPPRLLVTTDIGGDPDDVQSLVRLLHYATEFRIEGLIASSAGLPGQLKEPIVCDDELLRIIASTGDWRTNLASKVRRGSVARGRDAIGEGCDTPASRHIVDCIDAACESDRLNIAIWGGQTDFAQALWRIKNDRSAEDLNQFIKKIRVYDTMDQDGLADWIHDEFQGLHYILTKRTFRGMYLGGDEALTSRQWIDEHIHGRSALCNLYPDRTYTKPNPEGGVKEGDTPSWLFFLPRGGNDPDDPSKPGWGGRFVKGDDGWWHDLPDGAMESVSVHRKEIQEDFARLTAAKGNAIVTM